MVMFFLLEGYGMSYLDFIVNAKLVVGGGDRIRYLKDVY